MTAAELGAFMRAELPHMFDDDDLTIEHADGQYCRIRQRFRDNMLRPGGTVSGATLMALADCAMYLAVLSAIGPVRLAVTTKSHHQFSAQGRGRAGCVRGSKAFEARQAAGGRGGHFAVGDLARSDRPRDLDLFHSKYLVFFRVL
jgi:acyl-coenzyme A thioesterase PaaI-like protein